MPHRDPSNQETDRDSDDSLKSTIPSPPPSSERERIAVHIPRLEPVRLFRLPRATASDDDDFERQALELLRYDEGQS